MARKAQFNLTNFSRARVDALTRKAEVLTKHWQRERSARLLEQLAVNAETKQRWLEADSSVARQAPAATRTATVSHPSQPRSSPFKAWLAAGKIPVNNALAYIVSVLGLQRLASHQAN